MSTVLIAGLAAGCGYLFLSARRQRRNVVAENRSLRDALAAAEERAQADRRTRALAASLDEAIAITDAAGTIVEWNPRAHELFGFSAQDVLGRSLSKLLGGEEHALDELVAPASGEASAGTRVVELLAARKDGSVFQCELQSRVFVDGGEPCWVLIFRDIAERNKAQVALQRSEERYRVLAVHAPVGILETNAQGVTTFVNRRWTEITGIPSDEAIGKPWSQGLHPEDVDLARAAFRDGLRSGGASAVDSRYLTKNGQINWVHGASVPLRDPYGVVTGYMSSMVDVTARRRSEEALAKSEANFRAMVEGAPFAVVVTHEHTIRYGNAAYLAMLGYERLEELIGRSFLETVVHPAHRSWLIERERQRASGILSPPAAIRCLRRDGSELLLEATGSPLFYDGLPCRVFVVQDVTNRERLEKERKQNEAAIRESLREKEVLLKEIHHRVKNNLQVIVSLINLQASKLEDPATRTAFEETRSRVHAIALLHERLYGSKNLGRIDMREYLRGLISDLTSTNVDGRSIELHVESEDLYFGVDAAVPIGLIVNELVTNAYKHAFPRAHEGEGHVDVSLRREDQTIALTVSDNGVGYPEELDPETADSLGLLLIGGLSRQLGGQARFEQTASGARCSVRFPGRDVLLTGSPAESPAP